MSFDITPLIDSSVKIIKSYNNNGFVIGNENIHENVIIYYEHLITWSFSNDNDIYDNMLSELLKLNNKLDHNIELLILGTGSSIKQIPETVKKQLKENNINTEIMDSGAACRTYNSLIAEGRKVAAAILKSKN